MIPLLVVGAAALGLSLIATPLIRGLFNRLDRPYRDNHQGLGNCLIVPETEHLANAGPIPRRQRLSGMLNYYYRQAA